MELEQAIVLIEKIKEELGPEKFPSSATSAGGIPARNVYSDFKNCTEKLLMILKGEDNV